MLTVLTVPYYGQVGRKKWEGRDLFLQNPKKSPFLASSG